MISGYYQGLAAILGMPFTLGAEKKALFIE